MADVFSPAQRSLIMARIRGQGNAATEMRFIDILKSHRISGWRRRATVFGKPDFVFPHAHLAVFIDGCFWHSCPKHGRPPTSNVAFWEDKLRRNRSRDRSVGRELRKSGWVVLRIWQHELKNPAAVARRVQRYLRKWPGMVKGDV